MTRFWRQLRSPRLALTALGAVALYCGLAAWYPWLQVGAQKVPRWAAALHLDQPFSSPLFLGLIAVLFLSTAACTWDRTLRVAALASGRVHLSGIQLASRPGADLRGFLRAQGFGRPNASGVCFRSRFALWGGWVLHIGLLCLMAGVFVQQGFHDGGAFELAEGEALRLDAPRAVFDRERGALAATLPPSLEVGLLAFDPFLHQRGYAPDRASRLRITRAGASPVEASIDRAAGAEVGGVTLFQAIPAGLALVVELPGGEIRALHLHEETHTRSVGSFDSPGGRAVIFAIDSERHVDDPAGTGVLAVSSESAVARAALTPGAMFDFGGTPARFVAITRWGGFTYSIDPGMSAVFSGFALVLLGATLLTFPAGVAQISGAGAGSAAAVFLTRGREALAAEWQRTGGPVTDSEVKESS